MALFRTRTAAVFGIEAHLIDVEVDMWGNSNSRDFVTVRLEQVSAFPGIGERFTCAASGNSERLDAFGRALTAPLHAAGR